MIVYLIAILTMTDALTSIDGKLVLSNEKEYIGTLVIGGKEAPIGKYTFMTGLRTTKEGQSFCGGTLVSPRHVITAAHCAQNIQWVSVGTHYNKGNSDGEQIKVSKVTTHPNFNEQTLNNDIAVVELSKSSTLQYAALAQEIVTDSGFANKMATLIGWGRTSYPGDASPVLKELDVKVITNKKCARSLDQYTKVTKSMICAGGIKNQASCHGDSGGPLVVKNKVKSKYTLIGAVSWGIPCGKGYPDAYSRISSLRSFIDRHVSGHKWLRG